MTLHGPHDPSESNDEAGMWRMTRRPTRLGVAFLLTLVPVVAVLNVPVYNHVTPRIAGIPFFYWYQFGCLIVAVICLVAAYKLVASSTERKDTS